MKADDDVILKECLFGLMLHQLQNEDERHRNGQDFKLGFCRTTFVCDYWDSRGKGRGGPSCSGGLLQGFYLSLDLLAQGDFSLFKSHPD
jgi:hypothetical protein